ncbi:MAG TPA: 4-(cytidine 5'-diphospho)-2-C-methyl-D-erythritol kinase [Candidatus Paceibacterota bacterium]|nr:4-(cytidine 5'-diphospho)-2-C-methyl-D-erythritol kinase [Candidatus Paceibacterota bacterium]
MPLEKQSPCKVNLLLNILAKRPDGFHELETIMHPVNVFDHLTFARSTSGIQLSCSDPNLPTDSGNLVYRAAASFLERAKISDGVRIHLEKKLPLAAGLGGGSGNAATTLLGLNELFGQPLSGEHLNELAAKLGSDIPFFLQTNPALATGRGEKVRSLEPFPALKGAAFLLVHPGFGISTAWAYQTLAQYPEALNGRAGRAQKLINLLQTSDLRTAGTEFYNSLEAPALHKFPLLILFQEFLRSNGADVTLMSGSGSTTFALISNVATAQNVLEKFKGKFGPTHWSAVVPV